MEYFTSIIMEQIEVIDIRLQLGREIESGIDSEVFRIMHDRVMRMVYRYDDPRYALSFVLDNYFYGKD